MLDTEGPYAHPEIFTPTGSFLDGIMVAPLLGVGFVEPWKITPDASQDH